MCRAHARWLARLGSCKKLKCDVDELSDYLNRENPESYKRCKMTSLSDMAANGTDLTSLPEVGHIFRGSSADCSSEASQEASTVFVGSKSSAASVSSHTTNMSSCAESPPGSPPGDVCSEQPEPDTQGTEHILASLSQAPSQALTRAAENFSGATASGASNTPPASDVWQGPLVVNPTTALPPLPTLPALPVVLPAEEMAEAISLASVCASSMHTVVAQLPLVQGILPFPGQGVIRLQ